MSSFDQNAVDHAITIYAAFRLSAYAIQVRTHTHSIV